MKAYLDPQQYGVFLKCFLALACKPVTVTGVVALAAALGVLTAFGCKKSPPSPPRQAAPQTEIRGTGTLESVQEVPLAFKVGGRILALPFDEGSEIKQGQVLGLLDLRDFNQQLASAKASFEVARAGIQKAQADLEQVKATSQRARTDFDRIKRLKEEGILSQFEMDQAREKWQVAQSQLEAMEAAGNQARQNAALASSSEAIQRLNVDEARLLSPVNGILIRRLREPGAIVSAGTPVLSVVSTRKLWVRAWVDERALGQLQLGQAAQVVLRSHPEKCLPGRVDRIGRQADRQTHELMVDVELLELPPLFAIGQRADVKIPIKVKS